LITKHLTIENCWAKRGIQAYGYSICMSSCVHILLISFINLFS